MANTWAFLRFNGAHDLGHVGYGFAIGNGEYTYGSVENTSGAPVVLPGADNGAWVSSGSEADMRAAMRQRGYDTYLTWNIGGTDPNAATAAANATFGEGYSVIGDNCEDAVYRVLSAYGAQLPSPAGIGNASPNSWWQALENATQAAGGAP
ncbi:MAG: hypothetical protein JO144_08270 [Actinobacteria bacterium]|nr:hypothetical protein [Actinomycetota bacterium]